MFTPCSERQGTAYFEIQYCKKDWDLRKLFKKAYSFWAEDSLLIHVDNDKDFFENYGDYFKSPNAPDGSQRFDPYGINYYAKEHALAILEQIENDKPPYYEVLAIWLKKAVTDYNGFFFLGI